MSLRVWACSEGTKSRCWRANNTCYTKTVNQALFLVGVRWGRVGWPVMIVACFPGSQALQKWWNFFLMMRNPYLKQSWLANQPTTKMVAKDFQGFVWQLFVVILSALNIAHPQKADSIGSGMPGKQVSPTDFDKYSFRLGWMDTSFELFSTFTLRA